MGVVIDVSGFCIQSLLIESSFADSALRTLAALGEQERQRSAIYSVISNSREFENK